MTSDNLFAYGTLMCEDILLEVTGTHFSHLPGTITGFNRYGIRGETYPGLVVEESASVMGVVYRNISAAAWKRLDRFEGEMYEKVSVQAHCGKMLLPATIYLLRPAFHGLLEKRVWDYRTFLKEGKRLFQKQYPGFSATQDLICGK